MPIQTRCTECGKTYSVSSSFAGKRVRCKACQQPFTVTAVTEAVEQDDYGFADESSQASPAYSAPRSATVAAAAPPSGIIRTIVVLSRLRPNVWVLLGCVLCAIALGSQGSQVPSLFWFSLWCFPVLAGLFLINGIVLSILRAILSPSNLRDPMKDVLVPLLTLVVTLVLTGGLGYMMMYRRDSFKRKISDRSLGSIAGEFMVILGIAVMPIAMLLSAEAFHSMPKSQYEINREAIDGPIWQKQRAASDAAIAKAERERMRIVPSEPQAKPQPQ